MTHDKEKNTAYLFTMKKKVNSNSIVHLSDGICDVTVPSHQPMMKCIQCFLLKFYGCVNATNFGMTTKIN